MKLTFAIMGANLLVLFLYDVFIFSSGKGYAVITAAFFLGFHTVVCAVAALIIANTRKSHLALGFALSIPVILLVGFGLCHGFF